jgi:hypothetical protein
LLRNPFGIEMGLLATPRGLEMRRLDEGGYGADINERFVVTMRTEKVFGSYKQATPSGVFRGNL